MSIKTIVAMCVVIGVKMDVTRAASCAYGYHWSCDGDGCCPGSGEGSGVYGPDCCVEDTMSPTAFTGQPTQAPAPSAPTAQPTFGPTTIAPITYNPNGVWPTAQPTFGPTSLAPITYNPNGVWPTARPTFGPTSLAPITYDPTGVWPAASPPPAPVVAPTLIPTLSPDDESMITMTLTIDGEAQSQRTRDVAAMTDAEELSLTNGCVLSILDRLNNVIDSGNDTRITASDVSRTTLEDKAMRRARRSYDIDFTIYFSMATVTARMVTITAKTITSDNPLVVNYTTRNGSTALAVATSAAATPPPEADNSGDSISNAAIISIVTVIVVLVVVAGVISFVLVVRDRNARHRRVATNVLGCSDQVQGVMPGSSQLQNMMTHAGSDVQGSPNVCMTSHSTAMVVSEEDDVASRACVALRQTSEV